MGSRAMRVGVWGLGRHARRRVLPALAACADTELLGVSTRDAAVAEEEAARYGCHAWADPQAMLDTPELDAVYVATPIGVHAAQGHRVLEAGKHLWVEKSLTEGLTASAALLERGAGLGLAVCEAFMYAYHPQFEFVLRETASETFGDVVSISSRFGMPLLDNPGFRHSAAMGGGALLDVGCYPLSLALRVGRGLPTVVHSSVTRPEGFEVDMEGNATLRFDSGAMAFLQWGFGRAYRNDMEVWGQRGFIQADKAYSKPDDHLATVLLGDARGNNTVVEVGESNAFVHMLSTFARDSRDDAGRARMAAEARDQAQLLHNVRAAASATAR